MRKGPQRHEPAPDTDAGEKRRASVVGRRTRRARAESPDGVLAARLWFGVIGFGVLMYVLLDGFVLGLGILAPFAEDEHQLDT